MYVITGASGNTGGLIAELLLDAGKQVRVIGRNADKLQNLISKGAVAAIGDLEDTQFLTSAFQDATAVYALIPPRMDVPNLRQYQNTVSDSISNAIQKSGVKKIVTLSSIGAHLKDGTGPVAGLYDFEQKLKQIDGIDVLNLRAGYFMQNLFSMAGMIKNMGIMGSAMSNDIKMALVHTNDIASVATKLLLSLDFTGQSYSYVPGAADLTMDEATSILGKAIGNPELKYVTFPSADAKAGMVGMGLPEIMANAYVEMSEAFNSGIAKGDYERTDENTTATSLEWFATNQFAPMYNSL